MATIRKRGENTYQFIVSLGLGADNKYKRKYKTYRVTEKMTPKQLREHLEHEAYKFEQEVLSDTYIDPTEMTFKHFAEEWKDKWLEREVSENTIALRLGSLKNHIAPVIGHLPITKITTLMLLDLMENLTRKDGQKGELSVSAKQEVHKVLMSIFTRAVEWKVLKENPMEGVKLPTENKKKDKKLNVYDVEEVKTIIEISQYELPHWRLFISLALGTGMRRGELLGLEWKYVDLKNGVIDIQQIISKDRYGKPEIKNPKYDSKRVVSLPASIIEELKLYKIHCIEEKMRLQHKWEETKHDWVFFNEQGNFFHPDTPTKWWNRFIARTNKKLKENDKKQLKKIRLHDLRHTSATLLIAQNVHAKIISERLGHKKISTTMDIYGHALPVADREASEKLDSILSLK